MTRLLVLTDAHLRHSLVSGLRGFESPDEHDEWFVDMYKTHVTKRDTVWWLGDLTVGGGKATEAALSIVESLPGRKLFVTGNHDTEVNVHSGKAFNRIDRWSRAFDYVASQHTQRINGRYVNFSHYTYQPLFHDHDKTTGIDRFGSYRVPDTGRWLAHGHSHYSGKYSGERQVHVGLDAWGRPVTMEELGQFIESAEAGRIAIDPQPNDNQSVILGLH